MLAKRIIPELEREDEPELAARQLDERAHPALPSLADRLIKLLLSDVDGTLVTMEKELTPRAIEAVHQLHDAGILFAVTSGRPPRGMEMLVEPLALSTPLAAFNGGLVVEPDMSVVQERVLPDELVARTIELLESYGLSVWLYRGADWFVRDPTGRTSRTRRARCSSSRPSSTSFDGLTSGVAKIVGVSDDHAAVAAASKAAQARFGDHVAAARSQDYYLDVTHPHANKGGVVTLPLADVRDRGGGDRDDRRHAERRPHVRPLRALHRHGPVRAARCIAPRGA